MIRFAILTDVHSNIRALEAVMKDLKSHSPDRIYHGGDMVDCGAHPNAVCDLLRAEGIVGVLGNHDEAAVHNNPSRVGLNKDSETRERVARFIRWTHEHLAPENKLWLASLPHAIEIAPGILLTHAMPGENREGIKPEEVEAKGPRAFAEAGPRIHTLVCGHTHRPIDRLLLINERERRLINAGSVGLPRHGCPCPTYLILDLDGDRVEAKIHEVSYDHEAVARELENLAELPQDFTAMIREAR